VSFQGGVRWLSILPYFPTI